MSSDRMKLLNCFANGIVVGPRLPSAAQDSFVTNPKIYASNFCSIYKILWHPDSFVSRDSIFGLAGRRASVFFARHLEYFIMTRNCSSTYRDLVPFRSFNMTQNYSSVSRAWQKTRHRDTDGT